MATIKEIRYDEKINSFYIDVVGIPNKTFVISSEGILKKVDLLAKLKRKVDEYKIGFDIVKELKTGPNF